MKSGGSLSKLNYAIIRPIHKKGNKSEILNYRPISLLLVFSKVYERVVQHRLILYLENNNILSEAQFGFRKGQFTSAAIFNFLEQILRAVDSSQYVLELYCDCLKLLIMISF